MICSRKGSEWPCVVKGRMIATTASIAGRWRNGYKIYRCARPIMPILRQPRCRNAPFSPHGDWVSWSVAMRIMYEPAIMVWGKKRHLLIANLLNDSLIRAGLFKQRRAEGEKKKKNVDLRNCLAAPASWSTRAAAMTWKHFMSISLLETNWGSHASPLPIYIHCTCIWTTAWQSCVFPIFASMNHLNYALFVKIIPYLFFLRANLIKNFYKIFWCKKVLVWISSMKSWEVSK